MNSNQGEKTTERPVGKSKVPEIERKYVALYK